MSVKLSSMYGMDIYTGDGGYIGKVNDMILNLEKGEVVRVTTEALRTLTKMEASQILKSKSVLYKRVNSVGDIMIVGRTIYKRPVEVKEEPPKPERFRSRPSARELLKR